MWTLRHPIQFLLAYKDVVGLFIQALLFLATLGLIRVGFKQAKAASAQADAAIQQVRAAEEQVKAAQAQVSVARQQVEIAQSQVDTARAQFGEQVRQGLTSSRPNFKFRDGEPGYTNSSVIIRNVGPGVAYRITWKFVAPKNADLQGRVYEMGILGANQEMAVPWPFDKTYPRLQAQMMLHEQIRVECMDDAGRMYYTLGEDERTT